ncbi:MAG: hypothetical protein K5756_03555 [Clostridiales bacterium]|nr:hypothetical protein [Clostridiales bacterium]
MLYKKNGAKTLSDELFKNPTSEYRGAPFWAWNSFLTSDELCRQIDVFKEMGLGGFHMHVRTGLKNKYLSDEYMKLVKDCVDKAKSNNMLAWLYDEDRWPSGAAGGIVTQDNKYRGRHMYFTPILSKETIGEGKVLATYDIVLDDEGFLKTYKRIDKDSAVQGDKWYAILRLNGLSGWYNGRSYVDTLNKEAIDRFIQVTHERYKEFCGDEFDKTVPAIFTDEPQFRGKKVLNNSFDKMGVVLPWTDKVAEEFKKHYGADIMESLPELFWELPDSAVSITRYHYHDLLAEMFTESFADNVGGWCRENNIALTGHMMEEPTLRSQCAAMGEAMRSYRGFGIPGIDMLCNWHEYTTAKQAQSAVHQFGYEAMLSELYGVVGWDCDFRTFKHQGDWQAALGVTVRVPHLSWYAMGGEAKRDYPASIHYQSAWYKKYSLLENHFARVNTAMTRGRPIVNIGVIHPIESYWLHWGPNDKTDIVRATLDKRFQDLTQWLLEGSIDFDFISESLLPDLCKEGSAPLSVGKMNYDVIIVPGCETLRSTTVERLEKFVDKGGKLIFMGKAPTLCDAMLSDNVKRLYDKGLKIDFSRSDLFASLENHRTVTLRKADGRLTDSLLYQLRQDNDCRWMFIAFDKEPDNKDITWPHDINICINGTYAPVLYDTYDGSITPLYAEYRNGKTYIPYRLYAYDTALIKLTEGESKAEPKISEDYPEGIPAAEFVDYKISEENVLLLDMAEFKLSADKEYSPREELLRLDNICRERLNLSPRRGEIVQPWVTGDIPEVDEITLKFTFNSQIDYSGAHLALEELKKVVGITFNDETVDLTAIGNYVDIDISKIDLPTIKKGTNTLIITYRYGEKTNIENVFVLGDFGVKAAGRHSEITALPKQVSFGDLTAQGFPFYGANFTYKFKAKSKNGRLRIIASRYRGALISVRVDGKDAGEIIYPPYVLSVDGLTDGEHEVEMTVYISRQNTFGPLHLANEKERWQSPGAWRSQKNSWSYEYNLKRTGLLSAPYIINE